MSLHRSLSRLTIYFGILLFTNACTSPAPLKMAAKLNHHAERPPAQAKALVTPQEVLLSYAMDNPELTLNEPVVVVFRVTNPLPTPIQLDLGRDRKGSFLFTVVKPDGKILELRLPPKEGIWSSGKFSIAAGASYDQALLLNEWTEFPAPGTYAIKVKLSTPIQTDAGAVLPTNNPGEIKLTIASRNPEQLRATTASLLERITNSRSYKDAAAAALALSYVDDPIAVPALEKALSSRRMVEPIVIAGLQRQGNDEAVDVLVSNLKNGDMDTAGLARSALSYISYKSSDPVLKEKIRRAL